MLDSSPKNSSKSSKKAKIEKMKLDHSATSIQASWRGNAHRRRIVPSDMMNSLSAEPKIDRDQSELVRQESSKTENDIGRKSCGAESMLDEDDHGVPQGKEIIDDEENLAISDAERFEEKSIMEAKTSDIPQSWPNCLYENLEDPLRPYLGPSGGPFGKYLFHGFSSYCLLNSTSFQ